ncbi:WbuC family cupin fold metalloprotein [Algibacillus agarilyticus]|uniref:WbuC family cupin fold metalloprotein n=1 Tax=Algibacillus agarilyticus TaxID=2234133 RepID=UPI000DD03B1C|nr:WbuC family cupin fold metalloprotein [Algibacillus agarilyticus]
MQHFDNDFFANLVNTAQASERRRSNVNIHDDYQSPVQRLFIAMEPDSYVRPHKHIESNKWEFFFVVKGSLLFLMYDDKGVVTERITLSAEGDQQGLEIPPNVWHSTIALSAGTVFFEVKEGPYTVTTDKGFANWAPAEGDSTVPAFIQHLSLLNMGDDASLFSA